MRKKLAVILILCIACKVSFSQLSIGPFVSTNNIPVVPLKVLGGGISAEVAELYTFSISYFGKNFAPDSISYIESDGSISYISQQEKYKVLHASASFSAYLVGDRSSDTKFSAYLGAGLAGIYRIQKISYTDANSQSEESQNKFIFGFEFSGGIDYKLGPVKLFLRGKANIMLKHVIPRRDYDTALPLLTNTQLGILIPIVRE